MADKTSDKAALEWLFSKSKPQHKKMLAIIIGNCIFASCSVFFALMCRGVVDGAVSRDKPQIMRCGIGLFLIIAAQLVLRLLCNGLEEAVKAGFELDLRDGMLKNLLKKDYASVSDKHSGEILNRMFSDVQVVAEGVTGIVPAFVNMVTRLVCAVGVLIVLDKSFTLLFVCAGIVMFAVSKFFRRRIKRLHKEVQTAEGRVRSFLQETVENMLIVKVFGCEDKMTSQNRENQERHYKSRMKRRTVSICANAGFGFVFQMGYLYAMLWGARGIYLGTMTYGTLTAILQLVNQIQAPFANLSGLMPKYYSMTASAERIMELEKLPDEPPAQKTLSYEDFRRISLCGVSFAYSENKVLEDVNITIEKGEIASLTGISGGGKSTLFLLLMGAYRASAGKLAFETDSEKYSAGRETRGLLAYVPQGNMLFSGTVVENIAFLKENASPEEISAAAETACALDFIKELPDGFETKIGENGFGISEGQAQRIAIARAILSEKPIILLDEATSALDERTEAKLLKNIAGLKNKTLLIVTHRPAALEICTKRFSLKDGKIT